MSTQTDETTWVTFKRLWTYIRLYKAGLGVAVIALIINAVSDTYMISLLKPLLDEGFGNAESDFLRTLPIIIFVMMFVRGVSGFVSTYCLNKRLNRRRTTTMMRYKHHVALEPLTFTSK